MAMPLPLHELPVCALEADRLMPNLQASLGLQAQLCDLLYLLGGGFPFSFPA